MLNKMATIFFPRQSTQRKFVKKVLIKLKIKTPHGGDYYNLWMDQQQLRAPVYVDDSINNSTLISVVVPVYSPSETHLSELIYSVMSQSYENWELILSDASPDKKSNDIVLKYAAHDTRIKVFKNKTKGISRNTNYGLGKATGEYVAFCDHDDTLDTNALYEVAKAIKNEGSDIIYSDEDKISDNGDVYFDPFYKPDWSPDLLTHVNYINHLSVVRKSLLDMVGHLDTNKDGAQDYDLMLRLTDKTQKIYHIPKVLYHWRSTAGSTAQNFDSKTNITEAGVSALTEHFDRKKVQASVVAQKDRPGFYDIRFKSFNTITIIINPFSSDAILSLFVRVLLKRTKATGMSIELILPGASIFIEDDAAVSVVKLNNDQKFLSSALEIAKAEKVVIFNQPYLPAKDDWLNELTGILRQDHVSAVSPVVIQDNGAIQDAGLVYDAYGSVQRLFFGQAAVNNQTFFGNTGWVRNVDGLTGAVVAVNREDLLTFVNNSQNLPNLKALESFTLQSANRKTYNVVYTPVLFRNNSIELQPPSQVNGHYFNNNLLSMGSHGYALYAPESAAMSILIGIADSEGVRL